MAVACESWIACLVTGAQIITTRAPRCGQKYRRHLSRAAAARKRIAAPAGCRRRSPRPRFRGFQGAEPPEVGVPGGSSPGLAQWGNLVTGFQGADSEVGRLLSVIVHRPGPELRRITPRESGRLLFSGVPWAARAQQEHDHFTQALRD